MQLIKTHVKNIWYNKPKQNPTKAKMNKRTISNNSLKCKQAHSGIKMTSHGVLWHTCKDILKPVYINLTCGVVTCRHKSLCHNMWNHHADKYIIIKWLLYLLYQYYRHLNYRHLHYHRISSTSAFAKWPQLQDEHNSPQKPETQIWPWTNAREKINSWESTYSHRQRMINKFLLFKPDQQYLAVYLQRQQKVCCNL